MHPVPRRLIDASPAPIRPGVELLVRTVVDAFDDRVPGLAAEVAFFLLLSLPPLLLTVLATAALLGEVLVDDFETATVEALTGVLGPVLTPSANESFAEIIRAALSNTSGSVASIGFVVTLFTASRAVRVLTVAITIAYDLEDARPAWQQFVYGILITLAVLVVATIVVPFFVAGPRLGAAIASFAGLSSAFADAYAIAYWPFTVLGVLGLLALLYHVAAPWTTPWRRDVPGAVLAAIVIVAGSGALRIYARETFGGSETLFGPLAAPLVLLLGLYVVAFGVLIGAELNSELEKLYPTKLSGEKTPASDDSVGPGDSSSATDSETDRA